jgi:hypothetical protein
LQKLKFALKINYDCKNIFSSFIFVKKIKFNLLISPIKLIITSIFLIGLFVTNHLIAAVNDVVPTDYYPIRKNTTVVSFYGFHSNYKGPYSSGNALLNGEIVSYTGVLRVAKGINLFDMPTSIIGVLPWTDLKVDQETKAILGDRSTGFADLRLGVTMWPINNIEKGSYLGITNMVVMPTGEYDKSQILNPGENRWKYIISGGWQKDINSKLIFELSPELVFYGDNNSYNNGKRLEKDVSFATTSYLRYRYDPKLHFHIGGQINTGGDNYIDGVKSHAAKNTRISLGLTYFFPDWSQLLIRYSEDTKIDTGYKNEGELLLRYQYFF